MQRFEVRADAAYYTRVKVAKKSQRQWHGGEEGIARMRRLLESGAHDVFLFNGVSPDALPAALKQDLLARVARRIGWMSQHGERLALPLEGEGVATCPATGVRYQLHHDTLSLLED